MLPGINGCVYWVVHPIGEAHASDSEQASSSLSKALAAFEAHQLVGQAPAALQNKAGAGSSWSAAQLVRLQPAAVCQVGHASASSQCWQCLHSKPQAPHAAWRAGLEQLTKNQ